MLRLVKPSVKYKRSYLRALKEFEADKINREPKYKEAAQDFANFVKELRGREKGLYLQKGWVPDSNFWLVNSTTFIGRVSIRHRLTPALKVLGGHIGYAVRPTQRRKGYGTMMLKMGLKKAEALGLKDVLLTCDWGNMPSRKIIESSGGKLASKDKKQKAHYRIKINK